MSRRIKFRAWHTEQKKMYSAGELGIDQLTIMPDGRGFANISGISTKLSQIDNGRKMIPLQYTGLKDKNGKEIYEGDILDRNDNILCAVTFEDGKFGWNIRYKNPKDNQRQDYFGRCYASQEGGIKLEVIGNIYEHSYLLDK